jgi:hypothetical protein
MPLYSVFGACLATDVALPGLPTVTRRPARWTVRTASGGRAPTGGELLGRESYPSCDRALYRAGDALRYHHSCTGDFVLSSDGASITWWPAPDAHTDSVGGDIVGRMMAIALHLSGSLCLHGSAVALADPVVAFLAPKGYGKSTLAAALVNRGARLVTDDTLAVELGSPVCALPGVHSLRLCLDSAARLRPPGETHGLGADGKRVIGGLPPGDLVVRRRPLAAVYLLQPVAPSSPIATPRRTRLRGAAAVTCLLQHVKIGQLLGAAEASTVFCRVAALVRATAVYALELPRSLEQVEDVADRIGQWHAASEQRAAAW